MPTTLVPPWVKARHLAGIERSRHTPARRKNHLHRGQIRGEKIKNGTGGNAKLDRRHDRRALSHEEAEWLLRTTRQTKTRWKLSGIQRFWLYRLAMATGLRAKELASLTPESFGGGQVTINAASAKNRRKDSIPLAEYLIKEIAEWLAPLPANKPVWSGLGPNNDTVGKLSRKNYSKPGKHGLLKAATRNLIFFLIRTPKGGLPTFTH